MNENRKNRSKGVVMTLGIAAAMIALCAVLMNKVLAHAAQPAENEIHASSVAQTLDTSIAEPAPQEDLNILVYNNGLTPLADGVTAQYAAALTAEIAERVYGKAVTGRVFVRLNEEQEPLYTGRIAGLYWEVTAEMDGGLINCAIHVASGVDYAVHAGKEAIDWNWFDNWNEEAAEQERLDAEKMVQEIIERDRRLLAEQPQPTPEEAAAAREIKRQSMLDFAASVAEKPHGAKAVELVNSLGIGDGAKAVSGAIMMEGGHNDEASYTVEVALDNGKYLMLTMGQESMELFAYERYDATLEQTMYG